MGRKITRRLLGETCFVSWENLDARRKLNSQIRALENQTGKKLPPDFIQQIQQLVSLYYSGDDDNINTNKNSIVGSIEVIVAPLQADPEVARRIIIWDADCIISSDSNYLIPLVNLTLTDIMIR